MRLINYIKETRGEMKHVTWPSRKQATAYTLIVILVSVLVAAYIGIFDEIFTTLVKETF